MIAAYSLCVLLLVRRWGVRLGLHWLVRALFFPFGWLPLGGVKVLGFYRYLV